MELMIIFQERVQCGRPLNCCAGGFKIADDWIDNRALKMLKLVGSRKSVGQIGIFLED